MNKCIASVDGTKEILTKYCINPKQRYGQNFLVCSKVPELVANSPLINNKTLVIEIGPGLGALTQFLLQKAKKVIAYEIDTKLCEILRDTFKDQSNLEIINQDFLKTNIDEINTKNYKNCVIVSNLPYYITSEILIKILLSKNSFDCIAMMQKEVAHRILNKDDINELVLTSNVFSSISKLTEVSKNDFYPKPNVDSTVLVFKKLNKENILFKDVADSLFFQRRKTIYNNLKTINGISISDIFINHILEINGLKSTSRIDDLSFEETEKLIFSIINSIHIKTPAKINIGLKIKEKRHGMHVFESIFYPLNEIYDEISLYITNSEEIKIDINQEVDLRNNTVFKALSKFKELLNIKCGFYVKINKNIPIGAGLGGGSSDAGACLTMLKDVFNANKDVLIDSALVAGTDSVYFLDPQPSKIVDFRKYEHIEVPELEIELKTFNLEVETKRIFDEFDKLLNTKNEPYNYENILANSNDLEQAILTLYPHFSDILAELRAKNYDYVQFSGSGPTIVCIKKD